MTYGLAFARLSLVRRTERAFMYSKIFSVGVS